MKYTNVTVSNQKQKKRTATFHVSYRTRSANNSETIYVRLAYDGKDFTKSTGLKCQKGQFKNGKVKGNLEINSLLKSYETSLEKAFFKLKGKSQIIDLQRIYNSVFGNSEIEQTPDLVSLIQKYLQAEYFDSGVEFDITTKNKNSRYAKHLSNWATQYFGRDLINLTELKPAHDNEIIKYIKDGRHDIKAGHNHGAMHVQWMKRCYNYAISNEWVTFNPFLNFKPKKEKVKIKYLTKEELTRLENLKLSKSSTYERVRDFFVFSCYTGLAYMDLCAVSYSHLKIEPDGTQYLQLPRLKTDITALVPLLDEKPLSIIEKYRFQAQQVEMFTVPTNQCMNRTLKELAEMAEIETDLTFHVSRKTCGTLLISAGVDMAIVQKVLGHSSITTTINHYAGIEVKAVINSFKKAFQNS
jgi:site-specific recombinase XerD